MITYITTTSQKAVSMGPRRSLGRPKSMFYYFGNDVGVILGFFFHRILNICRKLQKCEISEEYNAKRASKPSKTFDFHINFSFKVHVFQMPTKTLFLFAFWPPKGTKKSPYWFFRVVLGAPSDFEGPQSRQKIGRSSKTPLLEPISFSKIPFGALLGTISSGF